MTQLKSTCGPHTILSPFTIKHAKHYALNWFNCLIVCPFLSKVRQVLFLKAWESNAVMETERKVVALGFYLTWGKLQLLQTSVNILYTLQPTCNLSCKVMVTQVAKKIAPCNISRRNRFYFLQRLRRFWKTLQVAA